MTFGLNLGEVEAFTFPGEDDVGRATTFSNSYASDHKENNGGYGAQDDHAFPDDVITRRQGQVKSTIKRAIRRLSSVTEYTRGRMHLDPQLTLLVHISRGKIRHGAAMVLIVESWLSMYVALMCIVWVAAVIVPFVLLEGKSAKAPEGPGVMDVLQVQNLQEAGFLYSYYPSYSSKESAYRFDLAYPFLLLATYLFGLLTLVRYSLKGFPAFPLQDKKTAPGFLSLFGLFSIDRRNQKKFSNVAFSSWNFNLVSIETSRQYRRGMRQKFQIMLQEAALEKNSVDIQMYNALKGHSIVLFFTSVLIWPFMVGAVVIGINSVMTEMESIEDSMGTKYAPAIAVWLIMKASSTSNRILINLEKWPKSFRYLYQLRFARYFFTRAFGLGSLVYYMYHNIKFQDDFMSRGNPFQQTCPEQRFGEFFYRLAVTNLVCECFLCNLYIIIRRNMGKAVVLNVEESLSEVAFLLGLFLTGVLLAPYIGWIIALQALVHYKFNKFALRRHYKAPNYEIAYESSSLSSWLIRVVLIAAMVISSFPVVYFMYAKHPNCGPHMGSTVAQITSEWVDTSPIFVKTLLRWFFHPLLLLSFVVICITGMLFMRTRLRESKQSNEDLIRHSSQNQRELQSFVRDEGKDNPSGVL
ncbi:hypothetical protein HOP50_04g31260 [Chloropicon primus]|nr:hypothetical protein HOP50_04g31260 [Chloropicon primus]